MFPLVTEVLSPFNPFMASAFTASLYAITLAIQWTSRVVTNPADRFWEVKPRPNPPAILTDPAWGNHSFLQTKNLQFHIVEKGERSKPLLLMILGFPDFWYVWRYQLQGLSDNYWCVAVDMRGYGDSDKPPNIGNYTLDCLVEDIKDIVAALGRERFTLMGHDWGGSVTWSFVTLYPHMIDSYIALNTAHPIVTRDAMFHNPSQVKRTWYMLFSSIPWFPETRNIIDDMAWLDMFVRKNCRGVKDEEIEAWKYTFGKPGAFTSPLNYYRANLLYEFTRRLEGQGHTPEDPPGLILFGTNDQILDLLQKSSAAMMCNTRYVEITGASHCAQHDDQANTNRAILDFLTDIQKDRPAKCP